MSGRRLAAPDSDVLAKRVESAMGCRTQLRPARPPMISVLVTGATGYVGGAVVRALRARGHRVVGTTRTPTAGYVCATLEDPAGMVAAISTVDAVVHTAFPGTADGAAVETSAVTAMLAVMAASSVVPGHLVELVAAVAQDVAVGIVHEVGALRVRHIRTLLHTIDRSHAQQRVVLGMPAGVEVDGQRALVVPANVRAAAVVALDAPLFLPTGTGEHPVAGERTGIYKLREGR